jgi:hypothetical protein
MLVVLRPEPLKGDGLHADHRREEVPIVPGGDVAAVTGDEAQGGDGHRQPREEGDRQRDSIDLPPEDRILTTFEARAILISEANPSMRRPAANPGRPQASAARLSGALPHQLSPTHETSFMMIRPGR